MLNTLKKQKKKKKIQVLKDLPVYGHQFIQTTFNQENNLSRIKQILA